MNSTEDCYKKALSLLSRRAYSSYKLAEKLKKYFSTEEIQACLSKLSAKKYLDDEQYLQRKWEISKKQGMGVISRKRKMLFEGFDKEILNNLTKNLDNQDEEIINAIEYLQRRKKNLLANITTPDAKEKIWRHLAYKGHSLQNIEKIWKILTSEISH